MAPSVRESIDTVIIGNGPAALILSYILHGHIPYYIGGHPDGLLDTKLAQRPNILDLSPDLYAHFQSSLRYSTQALPVNTFLDTLVRPNADTEINPNSCVEWRYEPEKAVPHLVIGNTKHSGGQWAEECVSGSGDIGSLSYAEMLSLPGYPFSAHYFARNQTPMPDFVRPSRNEVADYLKTYPVAVGISDSIRNLTHVDRVSRSQDGFLLESQSIQCKRLVLASGIFSINLPPPPQLTPLSHKTNGAAPLLVVGSGFSAADAIISAPVSRKIIHIFKWSPEDRPSPLRGCHHQAYPEYAGIYRQMKLAAIPHPVSSRAASPSLKRKNNPFFKHRDWASVYEGFPNAKILDVKDEDDVSTVTIQLEDGEIVQRAVGELEYVVGRRGSLSFLSKPLFEEVVDHDKGSGYHATAAIVDRRTLRKKAEINPEIVANLFVVGSLAGDSLIRHAFGTCVSVAALIMKKGLK